MYKYASIIIIALLFGSATVAQKACDCKEYKGLSKQLNDDSLAAVKLMQSSDGTCKAKGFELMGQWMNGGNEPDAAEPFLQKAEQLYKQNACSDTVLLNVYKQWAQVYYTKADFAKAQEYTFKFLHCTELAGNVFETAKCNTMIAQLFNQTGQAEKGIVYTRKAVAALPGISDLDQRRELLSFISKRYLWHYQDTKKKTSLDSSEMFGLLYLSIAKQQKNSSSIARAFSHLEGIAYEYGDYKKALWLLDSSFAYLDKLHYEDLRVNYFDKADILLELKKYDEAERMADSATYYNKLTGHIAYLADCYALTARIAKEKGNYKKAYEFTELERGITDSIRNVSKAKAVTELEKKYNQAKNETTIGELSKKKQLYLFLAIAGLLAAIAIAFFLRQQSLKHKKDILETEQRLNRARMNPHFFFNALTTLQRIAMQENDGQAMASNLSKFSNIMRETLESTYKEYVTVEQEIDFLNEYMEVQKIRFPKKFSYNITFDDAIEINEVQIPSMIIQPFVENSIEHGFAGIDYAGDVSIHFKTGNKELFIEIKDNGIGLHTGIKESSNEHISRASQIIKDRIYLLNIKLKTKAGFSIDNNENDKGVIVKIHLPLLYKEQTSNA